MTSASATTQVDVELASVSRFITAKRVQRGFVDKYFQGKDSSTDDTLTGCIASMKIGFEKIRAGDNTS